MNFYISLYIIRKFLSNLPRSSSNFAMTMITSISIAVSVAMTLFTIVLAISYIDDNLGAMNGSTGHLSVKNFSEEDNNWKDISNHENFNNYILTSLNDNIILPSMHNNIISGISVTSMSTEDLLEYNKLNALVDIHVDIDAFNKGGAIVGVELYKKFYGQIIKVSSKNIKAGDMPFIDLQIAGYIKTPASQMDERIVIVNRDVADKMFGNSINNILMIFLKKYRMTSEFKDYMINSLNFNEKNITTWEQEHAGYLKMITIEIALIAILLCSLIIVSIFNLFGSVIGMGLSRRSDISLMKTIGMSSIDIFKIFMGMGLVIGMIATSVGLIIGELLLYNFEFIKSSLVLLGVNFEIWDQMGGTLDMWFSLKIMILIFTCNFILIVVTTIYPAYRASKLNFNLILRE